MIGEPSLGISPTLSYGPRISKPSPPVSARGIVNIDRMIVWKPGSTGPNGRGFTLRVSAGRGWPRSIEGESPEGRQRWNHLAAAPPSAVPSPSARSLEHSNVLIATEVGSLLIAGEETGKRAAKPPVRDVGANLRTTAVVSFVVDEYPDEREECRKRKCADEREATRHRDVHNEPCSLGKRMA